MPHIEIERKFLIKENVAMADILEFCPDDVAESLIEQAYLVSEKNRSERVRHEDGKYTHTVKEKRDDKSRFEEDRDITQEEYEEKCKDALGIITKTRYRVQDEAFHEFCFDDFHAPVKFIMAEIEYHSEKDIDAFPVPEWMEEFIDSEVTDDPRFQNARIALTGGIEA